MNSNSSSLKIVSTVQMLLVLATIFSLIKYSSSVYSKDGVMQLCKKTHNYNLCMTILDPDDRKYTSDTKGLAEIVMERDLKVAKQILVELQRLAGDKSKIPPNVRAKCEKCCGEYKDIVYTHLPNAYKALDSAGKTGESAALKALESAANYAKACDEQFSKGGDKEPFANMSVHDLSMLAADIVHLM